MIRLTAEQIQEKLKFIESYANASNNANASKLDANANVSSKNVATLHAELNKDFNVQIKRAKVYEHIKKLFGEEIADSYIRQLESHEIYCHDESAAVLPYCLALSMYPFVTNGLQDFGGESKAPKHLSSYNGGYINMIFAASSQVAGAVASVEYLLFFDYFARKDYGENYLIEHEDIVRQELQQVVYAINQPASARGYQSVFLNWSVFDKYYFNGIFEHFVYPDGTKPNYESISKLQNYFMSWFNKERTKALLTFPVVTAACLHNNTELLDKDFEKMITKELSEGNAFFIYLSDNVSSLSSCCRLRNDVSDQLNEFSYSLGAGGVMTGSLNVITLNLNRFIQDSYFKWCQHTEGSVDWKDFYIKELEKQIELIHKYQLGFRQMYEEYIEAGLMPLYDANFINIDKQFLTLGINGLVESAEFLRYEISNNEPYKDYIQTILSTFTEMNKKAKAEYGVKFNTEQVPRMSGHKVA